MLRLTIAFVLSATLFSCNQIKRDYNLENPLEGEITIAADESFQPIIDAQIMSYNAHYPDAKLNIKYMPEQEAVKLLLKDSVEIAIISRELTESEQSSWRARKIPYLPAKMALEGVGLITSQSSDISKISVDEIKDIFSAKSDKKLVFDNSNSSNLMYMINKFGIKEVNQTNVFAANGNKDVFEKVKNNPNAIGVIGTSWISDNHDLSSKAIKKDIKVLNVSEKRDGPVFLPTVRDLKARKYPLERKIILHTKRHFGLSNGFIRFCCSQVGQLVVEKMGLLPYYIIPKQVVISK
jgi:phosphate transport system substrate-binding protein